MRAEYRLVPIEGAYDVAKWRKTLAENERGFSRSKSKPGRRPIWLDGSAFHAAI